MVTVLKRSYRFQALNHVAKCIIDARYRTADSSARNDYYRFVRERNGCSLRHNLLRKDIKPKTALIVANGYLPFSRLEALMTKALQLSGFRTMVLGTRRYDYLRYHQLAGDSAVYVFRDFYGAVPLTWLRHQLPRLRTLADWLQLTFQGVHVGRFSVASTLRGRRVGQLDFSNRDVMAELEETLEESVRNTEAAARLLDEVQPDCVLVMDRGYLGHGEIFDLALARGLDAIVWTLGYRSDTLLLKRYNVSNEREHPNSLSVDSWRQIREMPWGPAYGSAIRDELRRCYEAEDWFSLVGTQFDKQIFTKEATRRKLGLELDHKIAVVFPPILWDGSFFWGKDLFEDYTEWLIETIRAACDNTNVQWVVKLHPAHVVKAGQGNHSSRPAELDVIERHFPRLPAHVRLVAHDTDLSTFSLYELADYVVTVRGTVGIEAALFGIPVVTAGTGRYAHRGFTLDSSSKEEYLARLARLETFPRLSEGQVELAERYAYALFFCRPFRLESASLTFERDGRATPRVTIHCQTREDWLRAADMRALATWIRDGKTEDMLNFHRSPHLNRTPSAYAENHDTPARCGTEPANVSSAE
jgi:hypothetical protein